jgi:hypothetical protein
VSSVQLPHVPILTVGGYRAGVTYGIIFTFLGSASVDWLWSSLIDLAASYLISLG